MADEKRKIKPYLMALLASRLGSISVQMNNIMIKSARSSVLALARDCSTAICDASGEVLTFPAGFPVHVGAITLSGKSLLQLQNQNLKPGDAYLNNSPYHGNTHPADHTILVPVFDEDELLFICICRGHQADIGNSIPTTYHTKARDVYEEGALIFPCVKIQQDYKDIKDITRMCKLRIRVPEVWYGDYLAMIGAARIAEQELKNLIHKYGRETIKAFCNQWQEYGKQRMIEEIRKLPAGTASYETVHDPIPELIPEGVRVKVTLTINPKAGLIECDFTDNADSMPCGLNLCEATLTSAGRTGVLNTLSTKDLPHCEGALGRIIVKMREGSIVGKAKHPFSSSVATTNVNDRAVAAVQGAFNLITDKVGTAESKYDMGPALSVISGTDSRRDDQPYVTQIIGAVAGNAGRKGYDGYLNYALSNGGMFFINSVEKIEQNYPIRYIRQEILTDAIGAGQWDGAPSIDTILATLKDPVTFVYVADGANNPSRGAAKGRDGVPARVYRVKVKKRDVIELIEELPTIHEITLASGEAIHGVYSSSGGYGDPLDRDPELVCHRVREEWISSDFAKDVYGVLINMDSEIFSVDLNATEAFRRELCRQKG